MLSKINLIAANELEIGDIIHLCLTRIIRGIGLRKNMSGTKRQQALADAHAHTSWLNVD